MYTRRFATAARIGVVATIAAATIAAAGLGLGAAPAAAANSASLSLSKQVFQPGTTTPIDGPLAPGDPFDYSITVACSGLTEGCINATTVDTIPDGVTIDVPASEPPLYTVDYVDATRLLTITYINPLPSPPSPPGSVGIPAGSALTVTVHGTVDADATDGEVITNSAEVTADNADPDSGDATITVNVPPDLKPVATKTLTPDTVVAQSNAGVTFTLGVRNDSSSTTEVSSLTVADNSADTWDDFDLVSVGPVTAFPAGADQVAVTVHLADGDTVTGDPQPGPDLVLPDGVDPADVVGVEFTFSNSSGLPLPNGGVGGSVQIQAELRTTVRSTGETLNPTAELAQTNCASPSATDTSGASADGADDCKTFTILPGSPLIGGSKKFFPDAAGTYTPNGYVVEGENSGASAVSTATNNSAFPVTSMTITDPSTTASSDFAGFDPDGMKIVFPTGATSAEGVFTCSDGTTSSFTRTPPPTTAVIDSTGCPDGTHATSVEVTFTGSIPPGANGSLGVHGTINDSVPGGSALTNCVDASINSPAGTSSGTACADLTVEPPRTTISGSKTSSGPDTGNELVPGQPFTFTARATNNGNLPQTEFVITDPAGTPNPFDDVRLVSASISTSPAALADQFALEVLDGSTWVPYDASDTALLDRAAGVRARLVSGVVEPTQSVTLTVVVTPRDGVPAGTTITNCQITTVASVDGTGSSGSLCAATTSVSDPRVGGQVGKAIVPAELPRPIAGVPAKTASVRLRVANTGNLPMNRIVVTDPDQSQADPTAFFDSVDLVSLDAVNFPPGADRVQVDACTTTTACASGAYTLGSPGTTAALPAGVAAAAVVGLRFTFSHDGAGPDDYPLVPGSNFPSDGACPNATICFTVQPRVTLRSDPSTPIPDTIPNVTAATGGTVLSHGDQAPLGNAPAALDIVPGSLELTTSKSAAPTSVPSGSPVLYRLTTRNTGDGAVPALVVTEPIPDGLVFDPTFAGDNGEPYTITSTVPDGTPPVPTPTFTPIADPSTGAVTSLVWQFPADFEFLPGSTITLGFQATLAPGTAAGTHVTNTFGAGTGDDAAKPDLTCGNGTPDPDLGCTASAEVVAQSGSAIDAQKWVHGDDSLGFFNTRTNTLVEVGDPRCPVLRENGHGYTRFPCVAQILAGQDFNYLLAFTNVGTTPATQTRIVDDLPMIGDKGVIVPGGRGTEWDPRPLLRAAPHLVSGEPGDLSNAYAPTAPGCILDLRPAPSACPPGAWDPTFDNEAESIRMYIDFPTPLAPGASTQLIIPMVAPTDLTGDKYQPVAWNSFAHSDFFRQPDGSTTQLPAVEPVKVGVIMPFGDLAITKTVAGPLPPGSVVGPFTISYRCLVGTVDVAHGTEQFAGGDTVTVRHIPAGAVCTVDETDSGGAVVTNPGPVTISVQPGVDQPTPTAIDITNTFTAPRLVITKQVTGPGHGPYAVRIGCTQDGVAVSGYPRTVTFNGPGTVSRTDIPVGATCTATETADGGAASTTITYSDGDHALIRTNVDAVITVTNAFTPGGGGLPVTGNSLVPLGAAGAALILTGAFLVLLSRRRVVALS